MRKKYLLAGLVLLGLTACAGGEVKASPSPVPGLTGELLLGIWHNQDRSQSGNVHTFFYQDGSVKHLGSETREMGTWTLNGDGRVLATFERCYYGGEGAFTRIEGAGYQCWYTLDPDGETLVRECPEPLDGDCDDYNVPLVRVEKPVQSAPSENACVFRVEVDPGRFILAQTTRLEEQGKTRVEVFQEDGITLYVPAQTFELAPAVGGVAGGGVDSWVELTDLDGDGHQDFAVRFEDGEAFRRTLFLWDTEGGTFVCRTDPYFLEREIQAGGGTYVLRFLGADGPNLDRVEVCRRGETDRPIQTFAGFVCGAGTRFDTEYVQEDLNFDGHRDFRILASQGRAGSEYFCWLWDPKSERFQFRGTLSLTDPVFDSGAKLVYSSVSYGLGGFSRRVLHWEGNELLPLYEMSLDTDGEEMRNVFSVCRDGTWGEMKRWTAPVGTAGDSRVLPGAEPYLALLSSERQADARQPGEYHAWTLLDMGPGQENWAVRLVSEYESGDIRAARNELKRVEIYGLADLTTPIQQFEMDGWAAWASMFPPGTNFGFKAEDLNFDGFRDFRVFQLMGNVNAAEYCFIWTEKGFIRNEVLDNVTFLEVDEEHQTLKGWNRSSCCDNITDLYRWIDGEPVLVRRVRTEILGEGGPCTYTIWDYVDGGLQEVRKYEEIDHDRDAETCAEVERWMTDPDYHGGWIEVSPKALF